MKPQTKVLVVLGSGLWALKLVAENSAPAAQPAPSQQPQSGIQRVKVFDDRVFELGIDKPAPPTTSKSGTSGAERYLADEEDINTGQRKQWMEKCEGAPDSKTLRDCYAREKQRGIRQLREKFNTRSTGDMRSPWQGEDKRGKGIPKE